MSIFHRALPLVILLIAANSSHAQAISKDYQMNCAVEQVAEHKNAKGKALTEEDFSAYCSCQAEFISRNASKSQANELAMNPKAKPEWLKTIELRAMKSCLSADSKMST